MKKQFICKIMAVISCVSLSTSVLGPIMVSANEVTDAKKDFINEVLPTYLQDCGATSDQVYVSNEFDVDTNDGSDTSMYFVIDNSKILGTLTVGELDGQFYSSFEKNDGSNREFEKVEESYINKKEISVNVGNDFEIYSGYDSAISDRNYSLIEKEYPIDVTASSDSALYHIQLNTKRVPNGEYNGVPLCWAAVIATKYNYRNNSNMVASYVAYALSGKYGATPIGTPLWILRGYDYILGANLVKKYDGMMDYNQIINQLKKNNPIHMSLSSSTANHAVLLSGINVYNGYAVYYIDDPNSSTTAHIAVRVSSGTMNGTENFVYYNSQVHAYTNWRWSYY